MATYRITAPDGSQWDINAPEGATEEAVMRYAQASFKHKAKAEPPLKTTDSMSGMEKFLAGAGKAFHDPYLGAKQLLGLADQAEVDDYKARGKDLTDTGAGMAGNITGAVASLVPTAFIPGANTLAGAGAIGAVSGFLEPTGADESRLKNTAGGGALGVGGQVAGRAIMSGAKGAKALAEPFYEKGREQIAARTIQNFSGDPNIAQKLSRPSELVAGSKPTAAQLTQDAGLARLENTLQQVNPQVQQSFLNRMGEQNAARLEALRGVAGEPGKREFYEQSRETTAKELYERAFAETPNDTKWIKGEVTKLMQRPGFVKALKEAQEIAMNEGIKISPKNPEHTTRLLHYTKLALDDQIGAFQGNTRKALMDTRDKLVSLMESKDFSPSYREARDTYAKMSKPIDQMKIGEEILSRATSNTDRVQGNPQLYAESLGRLMKHGDETAKQATGFNRASLEGVMAPEQMGALNSVLQDATRAQSAQGLVKAAGSNTAQNLASQNILRQTLGPLGLPQSWAESNLLGTLARPVEFAYKKADVPLQAELGNLLLNPQEAARVAALAQQMGVPESVAREILKFMPQLTLGAGPGLLGAYAPQ